MGALTGGLYPGQHDVVRIGASTAPWVLVVRRVSPTDTTSFVIGTADSDRRLFADPYTSLLAGAAGLVRGDDLVDGATGSAFTEELSAGDVVVTDGGVIVGRVAEKPTDDQVLYLDDPFAGSTDVGVYLLKATPTEKTFGAGELVRVFTLGVDESGAAIASRAFFAIRAVEGQITYTIEAPGPIPTVVQHGTSGAPL